VSPFIKDTSIEEVQSAADIVEVVSEYTSLRKKGSTYLGLCPFHQEKTPSFSVSKDKGLYYCFGCGVGGDTLNFIRELENLSFSEAVEHLADRFSVEIKYEEGRGPSAEGREREVALREILEKATRFYERYLWETKKGEPAREYLAARGLNEEVARLFRVGLSPEAWRGLLDKAVQDGFTEQDLVDTGLVVRREVRGKVRTYDRFRGRLMFPLVDHRGRVLGFGGRALGDSSPKYLNSPEGPLYRKGRLLYGLYQAKKAMAREDESLVVEGYTDVLALSQAGVENAVASMGTALTEGQVRLMTRFAKNITLMFDADKAGVGAALRSGGLARRQGLRPRVVALPTGEDPADVAASSGPDGIKELLSARTSLLRFELQRVMDSADLSDTEGRIRAFDDVRELLSKAVSSQEREEEVAFVADRLHLSEANVSALLREAAERSGPSASREDFHSTGPIIDKVLSAEAALERDFLVSAACNPGQAGETLNNLSSDHFVDRVHREVFRALKGALTADDPAGKLRDLAGGDSEVGRFFVRIVMEVEEDRYSSAVMDELSLRLQKAHLSRRIAEFREKMELGEEVDERSMWRLEFLFQRVHEALTGLDEA